MTASPVAVEVRPAVVPPLDASFLPAVLWNRAYRRKVSAGEQSVPIRFALEQADGSVFHRSEEILPAKHSAPLNFRFIERLLKFHLWSLGGHRVYFDGPSDLGELLRRHLNRELEPQLYLCTFVISRSTVGRPCGSYHRTNTKK